MSIIFKNVTYVYGEDTPFEKEALKEIDLEIEDGEFIGIIGHTGCGKTTLLQHMNALLRPTSGEVNVYGINTKDTKADLRSLRKKVGLVFQYPEHQLFEETVFAEVAFGPRNLGMSEEKIELHVNDALEKVGLDPSIFKDISPFDLSGGQKRRLCIAGVLAMGPDIIIVDEPVAGLDPEGRDSILRYIKDLHTRDGKTIVLVSHNMNDIARLAERVFVMYEGRIALSGRVSEIFKDIDLLKEYKLGVPYVATLMEKLYSRGVNVKREVYTLRQAAEEILKVSGSQVK